MRLASVQITSIGEDKLACKRHKSHQGIILMIYEQLLAVKVNGCLVIRLITFPATLTFAIFDIRVEVFQTTQSNFGVLGMRAIFEFECLNIAVVSVCASKSPRAVL